MRNLRAVQLLGHIKLASTVRYLGIEVDDALEIAEQIEVYVCQRWMRPPLWPSHSGLNRSFAGIFT
jgi:hypothetical protein